MAAHRRLHLRAERRWRGRWREHGRSYTHVKGRKKPFSGVPHAPLTRASTKRWWGRRRAWPRGTRLHCIMPTLRTCWEERQMGGAPFSFDAVLPSKAHQRRARQEQMDWQQ